MKIGKDEKQQNEQGLYSKIYYNNIQSNTYTASLLYLYLTFHVFLFPSGWYALDQEELQGSFFSRQILWLHGHT